jgi:hypothetical protein
MAIPKVVGEEALLPPGRHRATLDEIEEYFVDLAPFATERAVIFGAFKAWFTLVDKILPQSRYWVDGGFVTHKTWSAPSDVDVMILSKEATLNSLGQFEQAQLQELLTIPASQGTARRQPMAGLVDGFVAVRGNTGNVDYWMSQWSRVRGVDGSEIVTLTKGFLEVVM